MSDEDSFAEFEGPQSERARPDAANTYRPARWDEAKRPQPQVTFPTPSSFFFQSPPFSPSSWLSEGPTSRGIDWSMPLKASRGKPTPS